jgi:hypothetical protein
LRRKVASLGLAHATPLGAPFVGQALEANVRRVLDGCVA